MRAIKLSNKNSLGERLAIDGINQLLLDLCARINRLDSRLKSGLIDIGSGKFVNGIGLHPPFFSTHRFIKIVEHKAQQGVSGKF